MPGFIIATIGGGGSLFDYFSALGAELASRGHRVIILLDGQRRDAVNEESNPSILTWPSKRPTGWPDARFLHALIKRNRPSCIIGNFSAVNICTIVGWFHRVPVRIAWSHTAVGQIMQDRMVPQWKFAYLMRRRRYVLKLATHVMAVSEDLVKEQQSAYGVPVDKIHLFRFLLPDPPPPRGTLRPNVVVCASRLHPSKGQDVLIRALALARESCPQAMVEFLGGGPMRGEYESLAASLRVADACRFLGAVPQPEVRERMASAAAVALPSRDDAFPLVSIEAASVGAPVIGSAVGGIKEMIIDGATGFLVPPGEPEALARKIILLLEDGELRRRLGEGARARFDDLFSFKNMPKHADFFENLIGSKGRASARGGSRD
jgi:glycosyltransferase involved in cell wall biosynthesis